MIKIIITLILFALISGCATEARISEYQACRVQGLDKFPVKSFLQSYTETENFQRHDGGMFCSGSANNMVCEPTMRSFQRQVQKTRNIDLNASIRSGWVQQCVNQQCIRTFGNADCQSRIPTINAHSSLDQLQLERYKKEVKNGDSNAQFNLGLMYKYGQGVTQDNSRAYMWLNFAELHGNRSAKDIKNSILSNMSKSEIDKSKKMISECVAKNYNNCD